MCTEKQLEYVKKLAAWKGQDISMSDIEKMDADEVSKLIDELKKKPSVKGGNVPNPTAEKPIEYNGMRFGLALKLVVIERGVQDCLKNTDAAIKDVCDLYDVMSRAEAKASDPFTNADELDKMIGGKGGIKKAIAAGVI